MTTLKQLFKLLNKNHILLEDISFNIKDLCDSLCKSIFENTYSKYGLEFIRYNINKFVDAIINASTYIRLIDPNRHTQIIETLLVLKNAMYIMETKDIYD